jgi:hypothetical protein
VFTAAISGRLYIGRLATDALMTFPLIMTSYPFNLSGHSRKVSTRSPERLSLKATGMGGG